LNQQKEATTKNEIVQEGLKILLNSELRLEYKTPMAHSFEMTAEEEDSEEENLYCFCLYS
jgi:hypothetical protein